MPNINWQVERTPVYDFQSDFFEHYDLLNPVLDSYNQVYSELINIIEKFDLKYPYQTKDPQHMDEQLIIGIKLKNPKIIKPGDDPKLPKTAVQAIAEKKDFMCTYKFDATVIIKLKSNNDQDKQIQYFIKQKMEELEIKTFDKQYYEQFLSNYFQEFQNQFQQVDQIEIPAGQFIFNLPVMTMSILDPVKYMSPRQKYDAGCNVNERGGDIVLAGIPYLIQNGYSYPYNQPIIAKSTGIQNQLMRADYLYQNDPIYGNFYTSIFLLIQNKVGKNKALGQEKSQSNDIVLNFKQKIDINFNESDNFIPVSLLFRAYGCNNDVQLLKYCNPQNKYTTNLFFIDLFQEGEVHQKYMGQKRKFTQLEALFEIGKIISKTPFKENYEDVFNITQIAQYGLSKYIYPVVLGEESPYCQTLGEICNSIYEASLDDKKCTDRDALYNKRFTMVGAQVVAEMRGKMFDSFKTATKGLISQLDQKGFYEQKENKANLIEVASQIVNEFSSSFSKTIKKSFTSTQSDNIKLNKNFNEQKTQLLSISQKREAIIKPSSSAAGAKSVGYEQRKIQKSHFGFICYLTTPEAGENIGRYLSPTIYSYITIPRGTEKIEQYLFKNKLFKNTRDNDKNYMSVKINYQTKGYVEWGKPFRQLYDDLLEFRHQNLFKDSEGNTIKDWKDVKNICDSADEIFTTISCSIEQNEINICTDAGRIVIPIFTKKGKDNRSFVQKLFDGDAMYICPSSAQFYIIDEWAEGSEQSRLETKENPKTWYFGPSGCLALLPAVNPLQNHNKAVRSTYSTSQMKNSQSQCVQNYSNYYLKNMLILNENQKQIIYAPLSDVVMWDTPITQMVYMGIMPFTDNQEDAMIISDDFIHRNGFATTSLKTYISQQIDQSEIFQMPTQVRKEYNYSKLNQNQNQITKMGTLVKENDVLISKVKMLDKKQKIDQSVVYDITQDGEFSCVCNVNNYTFNEINNLKCVRVMLARLPSIGDKVASVNAQKSTIGKVLLGCDMPIDEEGIVLNLIQDTNPIMKRETYGQNLEILLGKYALSKGMLRMQVSQDQFIGDFIEELGKIQLDKMYRPDQDEFFQNPIVLAGPINYTVQKHIVDEKIRYRADQGKIDAISKQSASGKKVQGGLKIGDMERGSISASGAANLLKDFFGKLSSNIQYYICQKCGGTYVYYNKQMLQYECRCCGILLENEVIQNGYSYNGILLNHILWACGAQQNFITDSKQ